MTTYVAFLRAINLGATRKFPKAAIATSSMSSVGSRVVMRCSSSPGALSGRTHLLSVFASSRSIS